MFTFNWKIGSIVFVSAIACSVNAHGGQFVSVYTDTTNNLSWSSALPDKYTNGCLDQNGNAEYSACTQDKDADGAYQVRVEDSEAAKACRDLGANLPSEKQYVSLIKNFEHEMRENGPYLTKKGRDDMNAIFGDMERWKWTSTVHADSNPFYGLMFGYSASDTVTLRNYAVAVRCVK